MKPTLDKMQFILQEQLTALESVLLSLNLTIQETEVFLFSQPKHELTMSRYNALQHSKSETLTKIRKLKEKIAPNVCKPHTP